MTSTERAWILRSLHLLHAAGVGLDRAVAALEPQAERLETRVALASVAENLRCGHSFSWSLKHADCFDGRQASMLRLGEEVGALDTVLDNLADNEEARVRFAARLRAALVYPCFLAVAGLLMVCLVPAFVMRSLLDFVAQSPGQLPFLTQVVLGVSALLRSPLFWIALVGLGVFAWRTLKAGLRREDTRLRWEGWLRRTPALGRIWSWLVAARFGGAFKTVIASGAPILGGLLMAADSAGSPMLSLEARSMACAVRDGADLSRVLKKAELFPPAFRHCLSVGLDTGKAEVLADAATRLAEEEFNGSVEVLAGLLESLVIGGMGLMVGALLVGTMLPLMNLVQKL